jgi:hypothetical protein
MKQDDALEAAKLAAMIGGQLKTIDTMYQSPTNNPANKINIDHFIAQAKNPNLRLKPANYLTETPAGFAPPPPEDYVQNVHPEPAQSYIPPAPQPVAQAFVQPQIQPDVQPQVVGKVTFREDIKPLITRSDIDSIRNSLKNIDKTLSGMLNLFKNSKLVNTNE